MPSLMVLAMLRAAERSNDDQRGLG
jgi:hypothetical protein